jgi:hypothetical protein
LKALAALLLGLASVSAQAAPFLWGTVTADVDYCVVQGPGVQTETTVVVNDARRPSDVYARSCKIDLANAPTGSSTYQVAAKNALWGTVSANVPFVLQRPGSISPPGTLLLAP